MEAGLFSSPRAFANLRSARLADVCTSQRQTETGLVLRLHVRHCDASVAPLELRPSPSVDVVVADEEGVERELEIHNVLARASHTCPSLFKELHLFQEGTQLLLRHPWQKLRADGTTVLRVDNPRDISFVAPPPLGVATLSLKEAGNRAFKGGDFFKARLLYTEALGLAPSSPTLWLNRGMANLRLGLEDLAVWDALRSIQLDPLAGKGYLRVAQVCLGMGSPEYAVEAATKGLRVSTGPSTESAALQAILADASSPAAGRTAAAVRTARGGGIQQYPGQLLQPSLPYVALEAHHRARKPASVSANSSFFKSLAAACPNVKVRNIDGMGRGVFALKEVPRGGTVFCEPLLVAVTHNPRACSHCATVGNGGNAGRAIACASCGEGYCSKICRDEAMNCYHGSQCGKIAQAIEQFRVNQLAGVPCNATAAHMLMFAKVVGSAQMHSSLGEFVELLSTETRPGEKKCVSFHPDEMTIQKVLGLQGSPEWDLALYNRLASVCGVNAIELDDGGCGLMRLGTFINHSCRPNVTMWPGQAVGGGKEGGPHGFVCTALRDIIIGEQLFISYVDPADAGHAFTLSGTYGVVCDCCSNVSCPLRTNGAAQVHIAERTYKLSDCSRCLTVKYCSRDCQRLDWKTHKANCKPLQ